MLIMMVSLSSTVHAQEGGSGCGDSGKDALGMCKNAPEEVHQYAFRVGEWESTSKSLKSRTEWDTATGRHRVYVADNGLTFVEEGLDQSGNVTHRITFDYDEKSDSWANHYLDIETGREVDYTSRLVDGSVVETIRRADNVNNNTYTEVADGIYIYTARRTYANGFTLVNHVGISTRIEEAN